MKRTFSKLISTYRTLAENLQKLVEHLQNKEQHLVEQARVFATLLSSAKCSSQPAQNYIVLSIPTMFIVVLLVPVFPSPSVTVHVWTPASRDLSMFSLMVCAVVL